MKICSPVAAAVALACSVSVIATTNASAHSMSVMPGATKSAAPSSDVQQVDRRGRGIALGIGALIGTAIILNEAARADGHRRYQRSSMCGRLLYRCEDGSEWSCRRYEDRCM